MEMSEAIPAEGVDAWKEVHQQLMNAVMIAKDSIAIQQAQRRFWLTEINSNLTTDGKLTNSSVWKRPSKKRGRTAAANKTTGAGNKRKKKADADGKPAKKPRKTKKKKEEEAAAAAAGAEEVENDLDDDDDDVEEDDEEDHVKPKLRLSLHMKTPHQDDSQAGEDDLDDETEDEEDDDDEDEDNSHEDSFLDAGPGGPTMGSAGGGLSPPEAHGFSSFLPGQFPSFYMQQPRGQGIMPPTSFATAQDQDDSDEDTEEDDY